MYFICQYKKKKDIVARYLTFKDMWVTIDQVILDRHFHHCGSCYTFYYEDVFLFGINKNGEIEFERPE